MTFWIKLLALTMALLMLTTGMIACGGAEETEAIDATETEKGNEETQASAKETESEDPRQAVQDDIPADLSFANAADNTVTFFTRDDDPLYKYEMDVDALTDDALWDAIYRRNAMVEERLGVVITTMQQNGTFENRDSWNQTLRNAVNTKSGDFEGTAFYMSRGSALATEGMYLNLVDFPNLNLDKPWWNQTIRDELTLFNCLFFLAGDLAISQTASGIAIFYNKDLYEELYSTSGLNVYQLVRDGEWTIDEMYDLVAGAWEDTNSTGVIDDGDVIGFGTVALAGTGDGGRDAWIAAMGINITTMVDGLPELSIYSERTVAAHEKVQELHADNPGTLAGDLQLTTFVNGNMLFSRELLNAGSGLRDVDFGYGVLPMPKFDVEQEAYGTFTWNNVSLISVLSSCPADKMEMVGATLELMGAGSYKTVTPTYYEVTLKSKYSNSVDDAEMYDLILSSYKFSFGFCYSTVSLGEVGSLFRDMTWDLAQRYESNKTKYQSALETLIDKLDEVSFVFQQ